VEIAYSHLQSIAKYKRLLTDASLFPSMAHGAEIPDFSDHFFIFHRGVSVDRRTNHFIWNKIDLLLSIIGVNISKLFRGPSAPDSKAESKDGKVTISSRTSSLNSASSAMQKGDLIERINLVDTFNRRSSWFSWLTTEVTVQEPSYERLILVYRESGENDKDGTALSSSAAPPSPTKRPAQAVGVHDFKQEKLALGPVRIKLFRDVPMADMELVYPEKSVKMNPADKLRLWISIGLAIGAVVWQVLSPGNHFHFSMLTTKCCFTAVPALPSVPRLISCCVACWMSLCRRGWLLLHGNCDQYCSVRCALLPLFSSATRCLRLCGERVTLSEELGHRSGCVNRVD